MNDHRAMTLNHLLINHESSPSASPEIHNPFDTSCCGYPFNRTIVRSEYKYIYIYISMYISYSLHAVMIVNNFCPRSPTANWVGSGDTDAEM